MKNLDKIAISRPELKALLLWAQDAIDFQCESDANAATAFQVVLEQLPRNRSEVCEHGFASDYLCEHCDKDE